MTAALTLTAPYGTLIALGVKGPETRGAPPAGEMCPPGVRPLPGLRLARGERLLIHQAAASPGNSNTGRYTVERDADRTWCMHSTAEDWLALPLGAIVASCVITDAVHMVDNVDHVQPGQRFLHLTGTGLWLCRHRADGSIEDTDKISEQAPYGDYRPGRWAWLLGDVKPTTERCPACWGSGFGACGHTGIHHVGCRCRTCDGTGACDPVPARGRQGVWEWKP